MNHHLLSLYIAAALALGTAVSKGDGPTAQPSPAPQPAAPARQEVALPDLPAAVQKTIIEQAGTNKVVRLLTWSSGDQRIYQAEWPIGAKTLKLRVATDGKVLGTRMVGTDYADFPQPVRETIRKAVGTHPIKEVEEITDGTTKYYEVEWTENGQWMAMKVTPDGQSPGKRVRNNGKK
jgi:hypothetical protein